MNLIPAYGRDYRSKQAVLNDFKSGKDFLIADISSKYDGKYCSIRDFDKSESISIRYSKLTKKIQFKISDI